MLRIRPCPYLQNRALQILAEPCHVLLPVQDAPFFTVKLQVKMLPCLIFFQNGVACDRAVGFDDYGATDDFTTTSVERRLLKSGVSLRCKRVADA